MKKNVFAIALALLTATSAWAFKSGDLYYNITDASNKTVEVTYEYQGNSSNYSSLPGAVTIPATVSYNGTTYSVTSIGEEAFLSCYALTQVTIGNSVTSIGDGAFSSCYALTQVNIPDGVESIGAGVFYGCSKLTQVTIPNSVTSIGSSAFSGCAALTQVTLPESVTSIGSQAFAWCSALTQVNIPDGVTSIGNYAFYGCSALTQVNIPNSVTSIGYEAFEGTALYNNADNWTNNVLYIDNCLISANEGLSGNYEIAASTRLIADQAFSNCTALTQVTILGSVTSIGDYAFYWCSKLTQVTIPSSVTSIGDYAFEDCYALTAINVESDNTAYCSVDGILFNKDKTTLIQYPAGKPETSYNIPDGVTSIGYEAFRYCSALTQVTIPESVTNIGNYAFSGCSALTQVTIGNSVESIGEGAFYGCSALTQVTIGSGVTSIGDWAFSECSALTQVTIGNSVESIGEGAFYGCSALTQVTIPGSVTSIGDSAFEGCDALAEITVLAAVPPTVGYNAFYNVSRRIPVYVPAEALKDYQAADTWKEFYYLQAMPTSLQTPSMPESISVYGGMLHNPQQLPVSLYDMQGRMVYSGTAATVSQPAGVYVLRCAGASSKVLF